MERISTELEKHKNKENSLAWACHAKALGHKVGFDFPTPESIVNKIREETEEIAQAVAAEDPENLFEEIGDLLLAAVSLAHHSGQDPNKALQSSVEKFLTRIRSVEDRIIEQGKNWSDFSLDDLEEFWKQSKKVQANPKQ